MTKKDSAHIKVVPYDNIGEARVSFDLSQQIIHLFLNSILLIKSSKQQIYWNFNKKKNLYFLVLVIHGFFFFYSS
jgi:hypothetical protein